jgi:hypothetical protein
MEVLVDGSVMNGDNAFHPGQEETLAQGNKEVELDDPPVIDPDLDIMPGVTAGDTPIDDGECDLDDEPEIEVSNSVFVPLSLILRFVNR